MGSKRPADPDKRPHDRLSKRPKSHNAPVELQVQETATKSGSAVGTGDDTRLSTLENLVCDIIEDSSLTGTPPEVMKAISALGAAFRHSSENPFGASQAHPPWQPTQSSHRTDSQIPPLPPISDSRLEKAVFTHPANANGHDANYDRLEILGDAYIELAATKMVWERFPDLPSGRISQIRELLVKNETLSKFAEIYHLDHRALVPANYSDQTKRWTKTKGDIFEAYVAAVVLSHPTTGYQIVEEWLTTLWQPKLNSLGHQKAELRSKEDLAKKVMGRGVKLEYIEERPSIHVKGTGTQTYFLGVYLTGWGWDKKCLGTGQGPSKTVAGDEAAKCALQNTALISEITTARSLLMPKKE